MSIGSKKQNKKSRHRATNTMTGSAAGITSAVPQKSKPPPQEVDYVFYYTISASI